jgi:glycosyltransferase involved in cell wall biosynthesis
MIKLSICIPTYNRSKYLYECLKIFTRQINDFELDKKVEIIVSDNNSIDNTMEMVEEFKKNNNYIKYFKNEKNLGVDLNVKATRANASGEYIWFFSDDDWIEDNSLQVVYNLLSMNKIDAMIINWKSYRDGKLEYERGLDLNTNISYYSINELLQNIKSTFFLSSLIFKNIEIEDKILDEYQNPNGFLHWGIFLNVCSRVNRIEILAQTILNHRAGNEDYIYRWAEIFLNDMPRFLIKNSKTLEIQQGSVDVQLKEYLNLSTLKTLMYVRCYHKQRFEKEIKILKIAYDCYKKYYKFYIYVLPAFLMPRYIIKFMFLLKNK